MRGLSFIFIASFLFLTSSCNSNKEIDELQFEDNVKQIVFFSDEKDYIHEASYYDAIIELKERYPDEVDHMMVISATNAKKYYDFFEIKNCPAILIVDGGQVIAKVNGTVSKDQIIKPLSEVLGQ